MKNIKLFAAVTFVCLLSFFIITADAAIFDDQIPPKKVLGMMADRISMYSDLITIPAGGTVEVDTSAYFANEIISFQGTNTVSSAAFFVKEQSTAGVLLVTGTASDIIMLTVWGKLDN